MEVNDNNKKKQLVEFLDWLFNETDYDEIDVLQGKSDEILKKFNEYMKSKSES